MKLAANRWVQAVWCDDIRQELGNKPSLMGVYPGSLIPHTVPAVLPRLGVWVTVYTPISQPFSSLRVRVTKNDQESPLAILEMDAEELKNISIQAVDQTKAEQALVPGEPVAIGHSFAILLGGIMLNKETRWLKVWADCESETLESFKLPIDEPSTANRPKLGATVGRS